jgi:hypothetical protein
MRTFEDVFDEFYALEGNRICYDAPRLEKLVILQMLILLEHRVEPSWDNFKKTEGWANIQKRLSKEAQFNYRNQWLSTLRNAWPAPTP